MFRKKKIFPSKCALIIVTVDDKDYSAVAIDKKQAEKRGLQEFKKLLFVLSFPHIGEKAKSVIDSLDLTNTITMVGYEGDSNSFEITDKPIQEKYIRKGQLIPEEFARQVHVYINGKNEINSPFETGVK